MPTCPHCHSKAVIRRTAGRDIVSSAGAAIGGICGAVSVLRGSHLTHNAHALIAAVGAVASVLASAALAGVAAGAMGAEVGATVGTALDERLLNNFSCTGCGSTFRERIDVVEAVP